MVRTSDHSLLLSTYLFSLLRSLVSDHFFISEREKNENPDAMDCEVVLFREFLVKISFQLLLLSFVKMFVIVLCFDFTGTRLIYECSCYFLN